MLFDAPGLSCVHDKPGYLTNDFFLD